jgi:hypothetical protein
MKRRKGRLTWHEHYIWNKITSGGTSLEIKRAPPLTTPCVIFWPVRRVIQENGIKKRPKRSTHTNHTNKKMVADQSVGKSQRKTRREKKVDIDYEIHPNSQQHRKKWRKKKVL